MKGNSAIKALVATGSLFAMVNVAEFMRIELNYLHNMRDMDLIHQGDIVIALDDAKNALKTKSITSDSRSPRAQLSKTRSPSNRDEIEKGHLLSALDLESVVETNASSIPPIFTNPISITGDNYVISKDGRKYDSTICQLFDYAVTGFAKCGTTSVHAWLDSHKDTRMAHGEMHQLFRNPLWAAKKIQQKTIKDGPGMMRGYCNPHDIQWKSSLDFFANTCPQTKLIVVMRHPVLWFESFYNYRIANGHQWAVGAIGTSPNELIRRGINIKKPNYVNSSTGAFHRFLAILGKTRLDDDEMELLHGWYDQPSDFRRNNYTEDGSVDENNGEVGDQTRIQNHIFLMDISQLSDKNATSTEQINRDITEFLGLSSPLPKIIPHSNSGSSTLEKHEENRERIINICDVELRPIHDEMMLVARNASKWIQNYFLKSPDVTYSENLIHALKGWNIDPCDAREQKTMK